jgi:glycosyltransferase involved in cell wall biosynthesis
MSTISVIIPTWNREATISAAINSALCQTYPITEVLVCDDGSDDNTKQIVEEIIKNDSRVKWIEGVRAGLPAVPRNRGLKASIGEWIAFLDSDDEWLPGKIQKQMTLLGATSNKATCTNAFRYISSSQNEGPYFDLKINEISFRQLIKTNYVICSSAIISRSLIPVVNEFPEDKIFKAIEDYFFWLKVATQTNFAYMNEPCLKYYDIPSNSIRKDGDANSQRNIIFNEWIKWSSVNTKTINKEDILAVAEEVKKMNDFGKRKLISNIRRIFK